jgi:hypothetical protein
MVEHIGRALERMYSGSQTEQAETAIETKVGAGADTQQPELCMPSVEQFKGTVQSQLRSWEQDNVAGLCAEQTEVVISGLAFYYGTGEPNEPDVETFKLAISDFQQAKNRGTFGELTEAEHTELIALLAPLFRASSGEETASTDQLI